MMEGERGDSKQEGERRWREGKGRKRGDRKGKEEERRWKKRRRKR